MEWSPLHSARSVQQAEAILRQGVDVNNAGPDGVTPLFRARTVKIAEFLISRGANVNSRTAQGWTPLHHYVYSARETMVATLLNHGADANSQWLGQTPLHFAADEPNTSVIRLLVSAGAVVDATDDDGWSPLAIAIMAKRFRNTHVLIELGARDISGLLPSPVLDRWTRIIERSRT
jgi:ankyrin repeat protein